MTGNILQMPSFGQLRQGDVFWNPAKLPKYGIHPYNTNIVHRGEGSNSHKLNQSQYQMFETNDPNPLTGEPDIYIVITPEDADRLRNLEKDQISLPATLEHEEHDHIIIAPGTYIMHKYPQREYDGLESLVKIQPVTHHVWD
jgi:hypothetical protein